MKSSIKKNNYILLEILIGLFIITMAFIPLLSPHLWLFMSVKDIKERAVIDQVAAEEFVKFKEHLFEGVLDIREFTCIKKKSDIKNCTGNIIELDPQVVFKNKVIKNKYRMYFECFRAYKGDDECSKIFVELYFIRKNKVYKKYSYILFAKRGYEKT